MSFPGTGEIEEQSPAEAVASKFSRFDVVSDHSDHQFSRTNRDCFSGSDSMSRKIMREWKILEEDLPETIYVRVYENRIDLLRAAIVGPAGTPYHGGLFFFDIAFPPDYPTRPPQVHYRSFGLRLNPNLYESGFVCVSLLNTWYGDKNEKWNPAESTVLQVLVSIQGLVLNDKPYFNEPINKLIPGGKEKRSSAYNESVFISSCQTMLYLLRRPPRNFEEFVRMHFCEYAIEILTRCHSCMNGHAIVGCCCYDETNCSGCNIKVSKKFKITMSAMYNGLLAEFTKNGASC